VFFRTSLTHQKKVARKDMAAEYDLNEKHHKVSYRLPIISIKIVIQHSRHVVIAVDKTPEK
jgi:hypothetical protein